MGIFSIFEPVPAIRAVLGEVGDNILFDTIFETTDTVFSFGFEDETGKFNVWTFTGTGFTYEGTPGEADFNVTGGTVDAFTFSYDDVTVAAEASDLNLDLASFSEAITQNELDTASDTLLSGDDMITGSDANEGLAGGDGNDVLDGNGGKDVLYGGEGDDVYIVTRRDKVIEEFGEGIDTVDATGSFKLRLNVENLNLVGEGPAKGVGNFLDNEITGNDARNKLDGRAGDDMLDGNGGADKIRGGDGNDTIMGGDGADKIRGGWGNDVITGGDGSDKIAGGRGADIFVFEDAGASDVDVIVDFQVGIDQVDLTAVDGISNLDDVIANAEQVGRHLLISTDNDSDLILRRTDLDDLTDADFIFAA